MSEAKPSDEAQMRSFIDASMARLKRANDPAWDPFEEFMACLPLQQQYGVIRFAMHRGVAPTSPVWIIFALSEQHWVRATDAIGTTVSQLKHEAGRIEEASKTLKDGLVSLSTEAMDGREALTLRKAELEETVRSALNKHGAAFRRDAFNVKMWSIITVTGALLLASLAFWNGNTNGFWQGYADGSRDVNRARRDGKRELLKNMLSGPAARQSPLLRVYLDGRLRSL